MGGLAPGLLGNGGVVPAASCLLRLLGEIVPPGGNPKIQRTLADPHDRPRRATG